MKSLFFIFLLVGCSVRNEDNNKQPIQPKESKYKVGDIVYMKPEDVLSVLLGLDGAGGKDSEDIIENSTKELNEIIRKYHGE